VHLKVAPGNKVQQTRNNMRKGRTSMNNFDDASYERVVPAYAQPADAEMAATYTGAGVFDFDTDVQPVIEKLSKAYEKATVLKPSGDDVELDYLFEGMTESKKN
jgi:hypothetical protein